MSNYIIGVDGGGTKTLGVLFTEKGIERKRVEFGFANFSVDESISKSNIESVLTELTNNLSENDYIIQIVLGIAGASKLENKDEYVEKLRNKFKSNVVMVTDADIALYSILKDEDKSAIMVLGGTGSVIMSNENHEINMIGGFGHLLGDEGSSYHLSITALKKIIDEYENNKKHSRLSKEILKEIKAENHYDIKNFVYNSSKSDIAKLSRFIAEYAINGDEEAIEMFKEEGKHLGRQTISAFNQFKLNYPVIIGLRGGFLQNAPFVKETLIEELDKEKINYEIRENNVEPIIGAYYLALSKISKR